MLTRFFPPKWRLRIVVLEILMVAIGLVQFAKTFDDMTGPSGSPVPAQSISAGNANAPNNHAHTKAETQAQLVQQLMQKYNKDSVIHTPLSEEETKAVEASLRALADELKAQTANSEYQSNNQGPKYSQ